MVLLAMARDRLRGVPNYSPKAYRVRVEVFLILIVFLIELVLTRKIDVVSGTSNSSRDDSCANMVVRCERSADTISPQGLYCELSLLMVRLHFVLKSADTDSAS